MKYSIRDMIRAGARSTRGVLGIVGSGVMGLGLNACENSMDCTLVGCMTGLWVQLDTLPTTPYRLEVRDASSGGDAVYVFECQDIARCNQNGYFPGLVADNVTVTLIIGTQRRSENFKLTYTENYPNGKGCPGRCLEARVRMRRDA